MRVIELAKELSVDAKALVFLLRQMGIPVADRDAMITAGQHDKVLARVERERRATGGDPAAAIQAALEEAAPSPTKRRRRRRKANVVESEPEETEQSVDGTESGLTGAEAKDDQVAAAADESTDDDTPARAAIETAGDDAADDEDASTDTSVVVVDDGAPMAAADAPVKGDDASEDTDRDAAVADDAAAEGAEQSSGAEEAFVLESEPAAAVAPPPSPARAGAPDGPVRTIRRPSPAPAASAGPGGQVRIQAEGYTPDGRRAGKDRGKRGKRQRVDKDAVQSNIQRVMAEIKGGGKKRRRKKGRLSAQEVEAKEELQREEVERERTTVRVNEFLTVAELAELVDVTSTDIIGSAFKNLGLLVTINQRLDFDQIEMLLEEFNYTAVREEAYVAEPELAVVQEAVAHGGSVSDHQ